MSANHSTQAPTYTSHRNPAEAGISPSSPHAYGVHTHRPLAPHPMPIYLGARNTSAAAYRTTPAPAHSAPAPAPAPAHSEGPRPRPEEAPHLTAEAGPAQAYDPAALLRQLILLLTLLLGLTLWLGGWQPGQSDARLGWSTGTIHVVEGTDGDTGARPASPRDQGVRPANDHLPVDTVYHSPGPGGVPVDRWDTFFEGSGPGGSSILGRSGGSAA